MCYGNIPAFIGAMPAYQGGRKVQCLKVARDGSLAAHIVLITMGLKVF